MAISGIASSVLPAVTADHNTKGRAWTRAALRQKPPVAKFSLQLLVAILVGDIGRTPHKRNHIDHAVFEAIINLTVLEFRVACRRALAANTWPDRLRATATQDSEEPHLPVSSHLQHVRLIRFSRLE